LYGLGTRIIDELKSIFSEFDEIDQVVLYGSRAKGTYRKGSDIDITLFGENLTLQTIFAIQDKIEELYLPYRFDISIYDRIDNEDLKDHIQRVGKTLYKKKSKNQGP